MDLPHLAAIEISARASNPLEQAKFPLESQISRDQKQSGVIHLCYGLVIDIQEVVLERLRY